MFLGAVSYPVLVASFFYLNDYLYYSASALLGLGAAILWSAQVSWICAHTHTLSFIRDTAKLKLEDSKEAHLCKF